MTDKPIEDRIAEMASMLPGTIGIAARNLETGEEIAWNANERFNAASLIKLPVLVDLYCKVDKKRNRLYDRHKLGRSDQIGGSGVLNELHEGLTLTLRDLAGLMIIVSDNSATNILINLLGISSINTTIDSLGLINTRLGRLLMDSEAQKRGEQNLTSPYDMMLLLTAIAQGKAASASSCDEMMAILRKQQFKERIGALLPFEATIASKSGWIPNEVAHDCGIIQAPFGRMAVAVMTRGINNTFQENETIARITRMVYDYYGKA